MADSMVLRHRHDRVADQHQIQPAREGARVALEVIEQLAAALVLVDAADVDRERPARR